MKCGFFRWGRGESRGALMKYLLLLAPCIVAVWAPLYNRVDPQLFGLPFFYWFQLALVLVSALVTAVVYFVTEPGRNG